MNFGKRLLLYSARDPAADSLTKSTADWGCLVSTCRSVEDLRGRIEGGEFDLVLVEPVQVLQQLIAESAPDQALTLPLAEVEKRHIHRVLASTGGNKTRAARILGIDTKTLYNKLKSYRASEELAKKRGQGNAATR
ncbi:MAG: hypothetical protein JNL12_13815 [Planctomycetes bacterium]|nr:hypothetical protein [Planctomycetota bacterium]